MAADVFGIVGSIQAGIFRVEQVVAEGGFAVVYRAYHEGFRAKVALKCLKVPDAMSDEHRALFLEKFREEGELLFRLSALEPAVVRPLHVDILMLGDRVVPFLALEWLEGEGLDKIVRQRRSQGKAPIEIHKLCEFLQPAARAFAQAHRVPGPQGPIAIIHRDIKPDNIFVSQGQSGEVVKILDFGIARTKTAAQLDAGAVTSGSALDAFTPGYAAPEQWMPRRFGQAGPWTDVFGLAVTMVEVLSGRKVFAGDLDAIADQTMDSARRPTPRALGAFVPDEVEAAFARALAVDPRDRTQSIPAFWTELETALGLPPSIPIADAAAPTRSLTGASEAPRPLARQPLAPARAFAPTQPAPAPVRGAVHRPEGDFPWEVPGEPIAATIAIELAPLAPVQPVSQRNLPRASRGGIELAGALPEEKGTMAPQPPARGSVAELREQLRVPIGMVIVAIAVVVGDKIYAQSTGDLDALGPVRPAWVAAALALIGVGLACWRVLGAL